MKCNTSSFCWLRENLCRLTVLRSFSVCLHSLEKQPVFVANHVAEIIDLTCADEWNHVQSTNNPADAVCLSRWLKCPQIPEIRLLALQAIRRLPTETKTYKTGSD